MGRLQKGEAYNIEFVKNQYINQVGFIAQELQYEFPRLGGRDENSGLLTIDYVKMILYLVEAIKAQQKEMDELKLKLNE